MSIQDHCHWERRDSGDLLCTTVVVGTVFTKVMYICNYCKVLVDLCVKNVSLLYLPFCPWQKCTVCTERKDIVS